MSIRRISLSLTAALAGIALAAPQAHAGFVVTFQQVGSNVVATGTGTLNTTALTNDGSTPNPVQGPGFGAVTPNQGAELLGSSGLFTQFGGATGPSNLGCAVSFGISSPNFGCGGGADISSATGDEVGVAGPYILVPVGYTSGAALSDSGTWNITPGISLGITPGTYVWTWGSGATADSFTITTMTPQPSPVPEPASLTLFGIGGIGGLALAVLRRRRPVES